MTAQRDLIDCDNENDLFGGVDQQLWSRRPHRKNVRTFDWTHDCKATVAGLRGLTVWHRHQDQLLLGEDHVSKGEENKDTFWEFSDATAETPTAAPEASEAAPPVRRCPVRNRRAPDRYTPT
ncbi:hypothetical protein HPB52_008039 [Rhipicephalus sanguineus]|uniref:Uncharacterized protein n=1 Tax=Rhipicephalus sanguineus TaxID=34632 RepID=A0A9D4PGA8_RHISA|nr:hypothetical protein HPB52_008039 [Rhipicephalus sanguineus]